MDTITAFDNQLLRNFFQLGVPVSEELLTEVMKCVIKKKFRKGDIILKAGDIENEIKIVARGSVHQYVFDDEDPITINITPKGLSFSSHMSYLEGTPSSEVQEAITDVELLCIKKQDMERLAKRNNEFSYILFKIQEYVLLDRENRAFLLQYRNPGKRFRLFHETVKRSNGLLKETPDKYIASYLNMTPQQYSKEKRRLVGR